MNVKCIETGKVYESSLIAAAETGACKDSIEKVCLGKRKTSGGLRWEYIRTQKVIKVAKKEYPIFDRPFSFDTRLMLVNAIKRGESVKQFAIDTKRSTKAVKAEMKRMKKSGEWERIQRIPEAELARKTGRRIA